MTQRQLSEVESGRAPIPPDALLSVLAVLRALPKDTPEQAALDFTAPIEDLERESLLIGDLVNSIAPRMGGGEKAVILTEVCRTLLLRQAAILSALKDRVAGLPSKAN